MVLLTRLIGPANYGLYAGSLVLLVFFFDVAKVGVDIYLVRQEETPAEEVYNQASSFLLLSSLGLSGIGLLVSPLLGHWLGDPRFLTSLQVMLLGLPLMVLYAPARARLERALDFRNVAGIELTGQLLYYTLALTLAWRGFGVWAPVGGFFLWRIWMLGTSYVLSRYRPRWHWSPKMLREMLGYGLAYSASNWVWQLRTLVNPLIVGHFLGPAGVGYVAMAIRLVEVLSFVKNATWRLAIVALAKVQQDLPRLRRALEEAMGMQLLGLGPLLAGFALAAPWLIPFLFGERWTPVILVYPFIALSYLLNAVFNMHSSVLYVLQRNWSVTIFHVVHITLFAGAAWLLVDEIGILGYGLAEVVALASYPIIHFCVARLFAFNYRRAQRWLLAFVPPLFLPLTGLPWGLGLWAFTLGVLLLSGGAHAQIREYWLYVRRRTKHAGA
jgi:PST family polysaccharide transporter